MSACRECGRRDAEWVAWSDRLGEEVCWGCFHATFSREEVAEAERAWHQHETASAIRGAIERLCGSWRWQRLRDLALDVELSGGNDVGALLAEAQELGVEVEP